MARRRKNVDGARAREASNPARADAGALDGTHVSEDPPHRIHPHDDEDVSQASHTGDSEWQLAAGDGADRDPAEGPVEDYERDWPSPGEDYSEAVRGAPEPPG